MRRSVDATDSVSKYTVRLVRPVAGDEGDAFLFLELLGDLIGEELSHVDLRVVKQPLGDRKNGVDFAVTKMKEASLRSWWFPAVPPSHRPSQNRCRAGSRLSSKH